MAKDTVKEFDSENIFDDFSSDKGLGKDIKSLEEEQSRDIYFYLKILSSLFKFVNIVLFLIIFVYFFYSYIQKKEELDNHTFLTPICSFILGKSYEKVDGCYSVTSYLRKEKEKLESIERDYAQKILNIIGNAYTIDNFINSKSVLFLSNKSKNKFDPIKIFSEFNALKNKFDPIRSKVKCDNINITNENNLSVSCQFFTSDWATKIDNGNKKNGKLSGTSISLALSFIDFIENNKDSKFSVISKPTSFSAGDYSGVGPYTKVTTIKLLLKYKSFDNLSL